MGQIVGGFLAVYLLSKFLEWAIFKRVLDDALIGCALSVFSAYILATVLYGFGSADGGPWRADGLLIYLPGAIIVGVVRAFLRKRHIEKMQNQE